MHTTFARASLASLLCALAAAATACDEASPTPTAVVESAEPAMLDPDDDTADDLTILVRYGDGDADLGGGLVEIVDCRAAGLVTSLSIPPIASAEAIAEGVPIEGLLEIVVADVGRVTPDAAVPTACADAGITTAPTADSVTFCIILIDASGNRSLPSCTSGTVLSS